MLQIKGMLVSNLDINKKNSLYFEYEEDKQNTYMYVFVNALTGNTSAWNGVIGKRVRDAGHGYLTYNLRVQINSNFDESINLTSEIIISDLSKLKRYTIPSRVLPVKAFTNTCVYVFCLPSSYSKYKEFFLSISKLLTNILSI